MILHALYENGGLAPADIEAHIKDDIEKEGAKLADMDKKVTQAYMDVVSSYPPSPVIHTSLRATFCLSIFLMLSRPRRTYVIIDADLQTAPVIEDDMMFADNGEMLLEYVPSSLQMSVWGDTDAAVEISRTS